MHLRAISCCIGVVLGTLSAAALAQQPPYDVYPPADPPYYRVRYEGSTQVTSLDGQWQLAVDPQNVGRDQDWQAGPRPEARPARVPWIIQETFPGYHGVAWYSREFTAPAPPQAGGRFLLRFWAVDYLADVWLNGSHVGGHEGGETPFVLDVTSQIQPAGTNRLAVRVLNPTNQPIDGITLAETARRCKVIPYSAGAGFNHGGITDSVELLWVPEVSIEDLFVTAEPVEDAARLRIRVALHNASERPRKGAIELTVASARSGETTAVLRLERDFPAGLSQLDAEMNIQDARLWELSNPYLYRLTARVGTAESTATDERSVRFGVRDFRFADGCFRLNGRRLYLRSSHTCNHYPIGQQFPRDPDLLRRDLINMKAMGFNAIRFIWGGASRVQLDLCDEIGLLVYEESYASSPIAFSPKMAERFDANVSELIRRDRNHPSVVIWGLLNEAPDNPAFRHAVEMLPLVRSLDGSRMVFLNSGRYDGAGNTGIGAVPGIRTWPRTSPTEPWVGLNATPKTIEALGITWPAGHLAFHPGPKNEFSAVRFTAPVSGQAEISASFVGLAQRATTDVHVLHRGQPLFDAAINLNGSPNEQPFRRTITLQQGDTLDFVVGSGNGNYGADTTGLIAAVRLAGQLYDATADFSAEANPGGVWSYGQMEPATAPKAASFAVYPAGSPTRIGSLANPGSDVWEDVINDRHLYPRVPHTAETIQALRHLGDDGQPVFLSEYGIGSAVDLWRAVRHFEQHGAADLEDARFFGDKLDRFLADWHRWRLDEAFARPEDFFMASLRKMAPQRMLGLNAIRANPNIVGHSLTGAIDHVMCGEGLTTLFRELKPGTIDAMFDAWAPLRWCLFAEPVHVRRGQSVHLEAVLADEDVLAPGDNPVRVQVIGPGLSRVLDRTIVVRVPDRGNGPEPPLARLEFAGDVAVDGPAGRYRFLVTFERGAAAAGGETEFYVSDPAEMPPVPVPVAVWDGDPELLRWLNDRGIQAAAYTRPEEAQGNQAVIRRQVILAGGKPPVPGGTDVWRDLVRQLARGSTVVFLCPEVFAEGDRPTAWLPLANKGTIAPIHGWLYLKDEWAKNHPIFEGLPAGGLMDYTYYREVIPDNLWMGQDPPAEAVAGAVKASQDYSSGLMVAVYPLGAGRFVLNTLRIRENLESHPAAERLLRNMLRDAARDVDQPVAELPAGFDDQLRALGFGQP